MQSNQDLNIKETYLHGTRKDIAKEIVDTQIIKDSTFDYGDFLDFILRNSEKIIIEKKFEILDNYEIETKKIHWLGNGVYCFEHDLNVTNIIERVSSMRSIDKSELAVVSLCTREYNVKESIKFDVTNSGNKEQIKEFIEGMITVLEDKERTCGSDEKQNQDLEKAKVLKYLLRIYTNKANYRLKYPLSIFVDLYVKYNSNIKIIRGSFLRHKNNNAVDIFVCIKDAEIIESLNYT